MDWKLALRSRSGIALLAVLALALLGAAGFATYKLSAPWRRKTALAATRTFLERKDYPHAVLSLRRALAAGPLDVEVCRTAAELCERVDSKEALDWRKRALVAAADKGPEECLLARTALHFHDLPLAGESLAALPEAARQGAVYHQAAGELAWAQHRPDEATAHWAELVRLEPANATYRLELAGAEIHSADAAKAKEARQELERLRAEATTAVPALRVLIQDAREQGDQGRLSDLVDDLARSPRKEMVDHLLVLEGLRELRRPDFTDYLKSFRKSLGEQSKPIAELMAWMNEKDLAGEVLDWEATLSSATAADPRVSFAVAEALILRGDWSGLQARVEHADWQQLDFMRHLIQARLWREQGHEDAAREQLQTVIQTASRDPTELPLMVQFTRRWKWDSETEKLQQGIEAGKAR